VEEEKSRKVVGGKCKWEDHVGR